MEGMKQEAGREGRQLVRIMFMWSLIDQTLGLKLFVE